MLIEDYCLVEQELNRLRQQYKSNNNYWDRELIKIRAKDVKIRRDKLFNEIKTKRGKRVIEVIETLF